MAQERPVSFLAFFVMWAKVMGWSVPDLHVRMCIWLQNCDDPVRVLMVFRGAAKSTIYAIYKAWKLYRDRTWRSLASRLRRRRVWVCSPNTWLAL